MAGILWLRRNAGTKCLKAWQTILLSGKYDTDQESIDDAERSSGECNNLITLPPKHILFAKDYIGMALTTGQTFIHLTGAGRMDEQDSFYRNFIVPRIYNSLNPPLLPPSSSSSEVKKCGDSNSDNSKSNNLQEQEDEGKGLIEEKEEKRQSQIEKGIEEEKKKNDDRKGKEEEKQEEVQENPNKKSRESRPNILKTQKSSGKI